MYSSILKSELCDLAKSYGLKNISTSYAHPSAVSKSAVIFKDVESNFQQSSWEEIVATAAYFDRTKKAHSHFPSASILEMQSSNSSDALAMNIFCHPQIKSWVGVATLLKLSSLANVEFGYKAGVLKSKLPDATEIDLYLNNSIFVECKLTEEGFTHKDKSEVEKYDEFANVFHIEHLHQDELGYHNYQLIRNILAANQYKGRFLLFCDMRRPDLAKSFFETVRCIKDVDLRIRCEIVYWQDIARVVGLDLRNL